MQHNSQEDFSDTVQFDAAQVKSDASSGAAADADLWPEAADFQCSEHASMFASSQSAPLNVV